MRLLQPKSAMILDDAWRDVRQAIRQLLRSPVFTITAVVTLALGIGATTAVFTLVEQVMLRSLPVAQPERLWRVGDEVRCCYSTGYAQTDWSFFSAETYRHFRANTPAFEELAALQVGQAELAVRRMGSAGAPEPRVGEYVSGNFFRTFGVGAWRGRTFTDADDRAGAPPVAVMSFHTWQEKYGSDPSVIGTAYDVNGHVFTIVGVAAPGFFGAKVAESGMPDLWLPLSAEPVIAGATSRLEKPAIAWLDVIGRMRAGADTTMLEAQLQGELRQWLASHASDMTPQERAAESRQVLHVTPGGEGISLMRASYQGALRLLLLAAACVLLVACANIANLLMARGLKDRHQTALRAALGASRARLVRKALTESLTLSLLGAVLGVVVAYAGASLMLHLAVTGGDSWIPVSAEPSMPVLCFALAVSVMTGVLFGVAPAWTAAAADPIEALQGANRSVGRNRHWAQKTLVIVQAALSLVLLTTAAMLGQSLRNMEHENFGFDPSGRYLVSINSMLSSYKPEQLAPLFSEVELRLRAIPGVRMASPALYSPLDGLYWGHDIRVEGKPEPGTDGAPSEWTRVTPRFFKTLGDRIVAGRAFTDNDDANSRRVAVINEAFAKRYFGAENPIGRHFGPAPRQNDGTFEIVGVARDVRFSANVGEPVSPMYFVPEAQSATFDEARLDTREVWSHYPYSILLWAPGRPANLEAQVKQALAEVSPGVVMYGVRPYSEIIGASFSQQHMIASLSWLFGAIGLVLAGVGLYGVTAYGVEQRTSEIGVRMALGADATSVVAMVLRGAFSQVAIGLAIGIPVAIGAGRLMSGYLFGVAPWDGLLLGGSALILALAASVAAIIPARRAAGVSPMEALRRGS